MNTIFLTETNVSSFIGKKISWKAPSYQSEPYKGVAVIKSVNMNKKRPLECETIYGDDLSFAFLDNHGLKEIGKGMFKTCLNNRCFSYSDGYREVEIVCE